MRKVIPIIIFILLFNFNYLFAVWVDVDGVGLGDINVSNTIGQSLLPKLYVDGYGNAHIIWQDATIGNTEIYYLKWDGNAWVDADGTGQESINISNTSGSSYAPSLSVDAAGNPHIAWYDSTPGNSEIYYLKWNGSEWVDADGTGQESINVSNNPTSSKNPSLFLDSSGNPNIAWKDFAFGEEIYFLKWNGSEWVDADGTGQESINMSNTPGYSYSPSLFLDSSGNPNIAWRDNSDNRIDVYYLKWNGSEWVDADGTGREGINVSDSQFFMSYDPTLFLDSLGQPHISWHEDTSMGLDIYYLKWNGSEWVDVDGVGQDSKNISNTTWTDAYDSRLYIDASGHVHVIWYDGIGGAQEIYYLKWNGSSWVDVDGTGQESKNISNTSGGSQAPDFYFDSSENPHVVWFDNTSGEYDIYYMKWKEELTSTITQTITTTITPTHTQSVTGTLSSTSTYTQTTSHTVTKTPSVTETVTQTAVTYTPTITSTISLTPIVTATTTQTTQESRTLTPEATFTITSTITLTITETVKISATATQTVTRTPSITETPTMTCTISFTSTITVTFTVTLTPTETVSVTMSPTITVTPTPWPAGMIQVYPNPCNVTSDMDVKFNNLYYNSTVFIYTLSVEFVKSINAEGGLAVWNVTNRENSKVAPGIYYYLIINQENSRVFRGKLFIIGY